MENKMGKIKSTINNKIVVTGFGNEHQNAPIVSLGGIDYLPKTGEIGLFTNVEDNLAYLGSIKNPSGLKEGEIKITCGTGYIYLRQNGTVIINGLMITNDGKIIEG